MNHNIFTEEGRTRLRNFKLRLRSYLLVCGVAGLLAGGVYGWRWTWAAFRPLEKIYFFDFVISSVKHSILPWRSQGQYTMLIYNYNAGSGHFFIVTDDQVYVVMDAEGRAVRDAGGYVFFRTYAGVKLPPLGWRRLPLFDGEAKRLFQGVYKDSVLGLCTWPAIIALAVMIAGALVGIVADQVVNRRYERGRRVRGSRLIRPKQYQREHKDADGLSLIVKALEGEKGIKRLYRWVMGDEEPTYLLRMKRSEEAQGAMIFGDIGTGKSQLIHGLLYQVGGRGGEVTVVYDPSCEFTKAHFNPERGDVILNPLDARSPFWSPGFECSRGNKTDLMTLADSFFPGRGDRMSGTERFFNDAARDVFARMLEFNPDPETLIMWLSDAGQIGQIVANTELAHYVDPGAKEMRGSLLATLAQVGKTLRLLPRPDECASNFSLTEWAHERRGWLFLTATKETEERLRPLYAAYLDLLMRRLMSVDDEVGRRRPVKLIVDEVHTLNYLPTLYKTATEGRKFGLHLIQGTQNKAQYDARYGQDAATMLSCPRYTILLRCKEPESAKWLSSLIGDEEKEMPRTGVTASVSDWGRDSMNYSTQTERRPVISKEEISALPDLAGYWKYGDAVVPFRFDFIRWKRVAQGFIPRQTTRNPTLGKSTEMTMNDDAAPPKPDDQRNVWELLRSEN
jgi:hypothetical protein